MDNKRKGAVTITVAAPSRDKNKRPHCFGAFTRKDSPSFFIVKSASVLLSVSRIIAAMVGYRNSDAVSFSAFSESRRDTIDVGDIKLQPTETMMRALEVTARARRFTMSGEPNHAIAFL